MRSEHIVISEDLHKQVKEYAIKNRRSIKDTCEIILEEYLNKIDDKDINNK